jgi:hypothetical protein
MSSPNSDWEKIKSALGFVVNVAAALGIISTGLFWLKGLIDAKMAAFLAALAFLFVLIAIEMRLRQLQTAMKTQSSRSNHVMLQNKYHVSFREEQSVIDLAPEEVDVYKLRLMRGVQKKVYAIHRIETFLPLPMEKGDDKNYFKENKDALARIIKNHEDPNWNRDSEYTIHRIFIVSKEALKDAVRGQEIKTKIQLHCDEKFDVRVAFKEDLKTVPPWEFAIYDEEVALRLGFDIEEEGYGDGTVYRDDFQVHDRFPKLYEVVKSQSSRPDENFWQEHLAPSQ